MLGRCLFPATAGQYDSWGIAAPTGAFRGLTRPWHGVSVGGPVHPSPRLPTVWGARLGLLGTMMAGAGVEPTLMRLMRPSLEPFQPIPLRCC